MKKKLDSILKIVKLFRKEPYVYRTDLSEEANTNPDLCSKCKGRCCKNCGCFYSPRDFEKISYRYLKKKLLEGYISIDLVRKTKKSNDIPKDTLVLRSRNVGRPIVDTDQKHRPRRCVRLTETGCSLSYADRPTGGKKLKPILNVDGYVCCYPAYGVIECTKEWRHYQRVLRLLYHRFSY